MPTLSDLEILSVTRKSPPDELLSSEMNPEWSRIRRVSELSVYPLYCWDPQSLSAVELRGGRVVE